MKWKKAETNCSEIPNKSDTIYRQAAIEAVSYSIELCNKALDSETLGGRDRHAVEVERNSLLKLKDDLKLLPPAQPKIKTGHWIWCVGSHKCSNCEEYTCFNHKELLRYCPNCGAKMEEEDGKSG